MRIVCAVVAMSVSTMLAGCSDDSGSDDGSGATGGSGSGATGGEGGAAECEVDTTYDPQIDPANFQDVVDNGFFPLVPGTVFLYTADDETIEVTVTADTKVILGVTCTVVHDQVRIGDEVIEDTLDWYAQDLDGAVWYMGEDTKEYANGEVVSTAGSWEAGVDGAKPGTIIPATQAVGQIYRQEYYPCEAEDMGEVLALTATAMVPAGSYTNCLKTRDTTPLEPDVEEEKYYCLGVGPVLAVDVATGDREELESITPP